MSSGESRREKSEERRQKREERRQRTDPKRPPEVPKGGRQRGTNPFLHHTARGWDLWGPHLGTEGRGKRAEKREKREERREKMAASSNHCISTVSRGHLKEVLKISNGHRNCRKLESLHFYGVP